MNTKPSLVMEIPFVIMTTCLIQSLPQSCFMFFQGPGKKKFTKTVLPDRLNENPAKKGKGVTDHFVKKPAISLYRWSSHLLTILKWLLRRGGLRLSHAKTPKYLPTMQAFLSILFFFFFFQRSLFWTWCLKALLSREFVIKWKIAKSKVCGKFWSLLASS